MSNIILYTLSMSRSLSASSQISKPKESPLDNGFVNVILMKGGFIRPFDRGLNKINEIINDYLPINAWND